MHGTETTVRDDGRGLEEKGRINKRKKGRKIKGKEKKQEKGV